MSENVINNLIDSKSFDTIITSVKNPSVKLAKALLTQTRQRKKLGQTVLEGVHLVDALLTRFQESSKPLNVQLNQILLAQNALDNSEVQGILSQLNELDMTSGDVTILEDSLYQSIRSLGDGVDIMAIIDTPVQTLETVSPITTDCLILNDVQDAGNVGTLLRTASCVGVTTIICTMGTASVWSPKTLRAGMGAQFGLTIFENVDVDKLLNHVQTPLFATSSHTDKVIFDYDLTKPMAWILGNEGQGVTIELMNQATSIALPQPNGGESLNVGVAGSVCLFEMLRQRSFSQ